MSRARGNQSPNKEDTDCKGGGALRRAGVTKGGRDMRVIVAREAVVREARKVVRENKQVFCLKPCWHGLVTCMPRNGAIWNAGSGANRLSRRCPRERHSRDAGWIQSGPTKGPIQNGIATNLSLPVLSQRDKLPELPAKYLG